MPRIQLAFAAVLLVVALPLRATSVTPPTFQQLVTRADAVFVGDVTEIRSELVTRGSDRAILTYVTFRVSDALKSSLPSTLTLEFLGGTVGDLTMEIAGMPQFTVGQRDILFVEKNGRQICPLVAMMYGRYRVRRDAATGVEFVARDNGAPLRSLGDVSLPMHAVRLPATSTVAPLSPAAFAAQVRNEVLNLRIR